MSTSLATYGTTVEMLPYGSFCGKNRLIFLRHFFMFAYLIIDIHFTRSFERL